MKEVLTTPVTKLSALFQIVEEAGVSRSALLERAGIDRSLLQGKRMIFAVNIVNDEVIVITTSIIVKNYQ